jgi:monofunctional glycosyltransferase
MRKTGRVIAATAAVVFGYFCFLYLTVPDVRVLRTHNPQTTAFIELRAREARAQGREPKRVQQWIPYARISQHLKRAVLLAEDAGFWGHEGIDLAEIRKSLETDWEQGMFLRGASTITQQLAKNLYLSPSRNPLRKLRELYIARRLEHELTKTRIYELYLNEIEWGDGIYGAEAAARMYFGESAASVSPDQAALMAGAIVNPRELSVLHPNARLRSRQRIIRSRMGLVTPPPVIVTPLEPTEGPSPENLPESPPESSAPPPAPEESSKPESDAPQPEPPQPERSAPVPQPFPGAGQR